jgi:hypothetical protein
MSFFEDPPLHDFPDRAIRLLLERPPHMRQLVSAAAPELATGLDFTRMAPLQRELPLPDWRRREADLLFRVPFRAGLETLICLLVEHTTAPDQRMPLRALLYATLYWEREWRLWEEGHRRGQPLRLSPVLPIVFYTGHDAWDTARTLADLMPVIEPFQAHIPNWGPILWQLNAQSVEALLQGGEWMQALAVVRAERESADVFREVFAEVTRRLEPLSELERARWHDLMWFLVSWAYRRRPPAERQDLLSVATGRMNSVAAKEEVEKMSGMIGQTWEQELLTRGAARGQLDATRVLLRSLLEDRFGSLPEEWLRRIDSTEDVERLRRCALQVRLVTTLEEVQL